MITFATMITHLGLKKLLEIELKLWFITTTIIITIIITNIITITIISIDFRRSNILVSLQGV